jgi:hypothetical protein
MNDPGPNHFGAGGGISRLRLHREMGPSGTEERTPRAEVPMSGRASRCLQACYPANAGLEARLVVQGR